MEEDQMNVPGSRPADDINLEEFERRLRAAGAQQANVEDPLQELARLVESSYAGSSSETSARPIPELDKRSAESGPVDRDRGAEAGNRRDGRPRSRGVGGRSRGSARLRVRRPSFPRPPGGRPGSRTAIEAVEAHGFRAGDRGPGDDRRGVRSQGPGPRPAQGSSVHRRGSGTDQGAAAERPDGYRVQ